MPIHAMIVDDEPAARHRLRRLARSEPDLDIVADAEDGVVASQQIRALGPDLVILDIDMPNLDGIGVAEAVRDLERPPLLIFVTAFTEHAPRAFRVEALDYLLKPVGAEEFQSSIRRVRDRLRLQSSAAMGQKLTTMLATLGQDAAPAAAGSSAPGTARVPSTPYLERIPVRERDRIIFVKSIDVDWFEATGNYVRLHVRKHVLQIRETMARLERQLDPARFVRIHRQTIVNIDRVRDMQPWAAGDYVLTLHDGTELRLSRSYRSHLDGLMYRRDTG